MQRACRIGEGGEEPATYVTPDPSYDYCINRREREQKGEDNKWDGEKVKKKRKIKPG